MTTAVAISCSQIFAQGASDSRPIKKDAPAAKGADGEPAEKHQTPAQPATIITKPDPDKLNVKGDPQQTDRSQERKANRKEKKDFWDYANALSTVAIAVFTFFLVFFGRRQAHATQKSVEAMQASTDVASAALDHAKQTASAQLEETRRALDQTAKAQRAWLVPEIWLSAEGRDAMAYRPIVARPSPTQVAFRNIGQVPAFNATVTARPVLEKRGGSDHIELRLADAGGRAVFGRDQTHNYMLWITMGPQEYIDSIMDGSGVLRVRVEMSYTDPIGTKGFTAFTMTYHPNDVTGIFTVGGTFGTGDSIMR